MCQSRYLLHVVVVIIALACGAHAKETTAPEDITALSCSIEVLEAIRNISFAEFYRNFSGLRPDPSQIPTELKSGKRNNSLISSVLKSLDDTIISTLEVSESARKDRIRYLLFTNKNQNQYQVMPEDGGVREMDWSPNRKTKVIIHGFNVLIGVPHEVCIWTQRIFEITDAYVKQSPAQASYNVIVVDWMSLATRLIVDYHDAAKATRPAGEDVADFLIRLKNSGNIRSWDDVHIIGHSLGAHVSGVAGNRVQALTKSKVARITGLDPAGPCFDTGDGKIASDTSGTLDKTDAKFVDIIHTNMGNILNTLVARFGSVAQTGHADFYPNGGEVQPGCNVIDDRVIACSHTRSVVYFAKSVSDKFAACPCSSWKDFNSHTCACGPTTLKFMGEFCDSNATGRYYLILS